MQTKFSTIIYETPDNWGETTVTDEAEMEVVISGLQELGEDWESCNLGDCEEFELIKIINSDTALYKRLHTRHSEYRLYQKNNQNEKYYNHLPFKFLPKRTARR